MRFKSFCRLLLTALIIASCKGLYAYDGPENQTGNFAKETLYFETESPQEADNVIAEHLREIFPIISDEHIAQISSSKKVSNVNASFSDSTGSNAGTLYKVSFEVPENFMADTAKISWELNIPEFQSRIYQLYKGSKIYIDTWPNVVGTIKDKTYTGNFMAYRIRNWPFYKDPDPAKRDVPPVKPGPGNPLGLFVVHYDENSLRYFHGTNKNKLLYAENRSLSHGCVRNDNDNIEKMKQFIIKRVVKSSDLSSWLGSKRTMIYDFEDIDMFPVTIYYKTYSIDRDENGFYITMFKDIYNYADRSKINPVKDVDSLVITADIETVKKEFNEKVKDHGIPEDALNLMIDYAVNKAPKYQKLYVEELKSKFLIR